MRPTAKGYFSGCGGMELGLIQAGVKVIQSVDIDSASIDCLNKNAHYFSHNILKTDVKDMTVLDQEQSDIMVFTYPCTKYSAIADIHGARTGDELFLHALRHLAIGRPEMFIVENVPGMKKFKVVMEAMTKLPDYYMNIFCPLNASKWLPQERKRLILIGTKKAFQIQEPLAAGKRPSIKDILEKHPEIEIPQYVISRLNGKYRDRPIIIDPEDKDSIAPTCVAHYSKDMGTRLVKDKKFPAGVRPFTVREYARLQGFPDDFKFENNRNSYKLIGNAVAVDMGRWIGNEALKYFN